MYWYVCEFRQQLKKTISLFKLCEITINAWSLARSFTFQNHNGIISAHAHIETLHCLLTRRKTKFRYLEQTVCDELDDGGSWWARACSNRFDR